MILSCDKESKHQCRFHHCVFLGLVFDSAVSYNTTSRDRMLIIPNFNYGLLYPKEWINYKPAVIKQFCGKQMFNFNISFPTLPWQQSNKFALFQNQLCLQRSWRIDLTTSVIHTVLFYSWHTSITVQQHTTKKRRTALMKTTRNLGEFKKKESVTLDWLWTPPLFRMKFAGSFFELYKWQFVLWCKIYHAF